MGTYCEPWTFPAPHPTWIHIIRFSWCSFTDDSCANQSAQLLLQMWFFQLTSHLLAGILLWKVASLHPAPTSIYFWKAVGWITSPQNSYSSRTSNTAYLEIVFAEVVRIWRWNHPGFKMGLTPMTAVFMSWKGHTETQGESHVKLWRLEWRCHKPRTTRSHQELKRQKGFSLVASGLSTHCSHLAFGLQPPELWEDPFLLL